MAEATENAIKAWIASQMATSGSISLKLEEFSLDTLSATLQIILPAAVASAESGSPSNDGLKFSLFFEDTWNPMVRLWFSLQKIQMPPKAQGIILFVFGLS
jgi:hypothetical protein